MDYDQEITACMVEGNTLEEIEQTLSAMPFGHVKKLLEIYKCKVGDLTRKISLAKGIKCSAKESKKEKKLGHKLQAETTTKPFCCL